MQHELIDLQREVGINSFFVTHAQDEALALSHRIAVMNQGRVEQFDEPSKIYGFPQNRFVADFIGNTTCWRGSDRVASDHLRSQYRGWVRLWRRRGKTRARVSGLVRRAARQVSIGTRP